LEKKKRNERRIALQFEGERAPRQEKNQKKQKKPDGGGAYVCEETRIKKKSANK